MSIRNKSVNDNFAIILDGTLEKYNYDIHINDWVVYPFGSYIDFGIRIYNILSVNSFCMYIPYKINPEEIQDLGPLFGDEKTARVLTNTSAKITTSTASPIIDISYYNITESIIFIKQLNKSVYSCCNGTIIEFFFNNMHSLIKNGNGYIRFRIPHKSLNQVFISKRHDYKFSFDSPIITDKYQHTIKINEFRSLPSEIRQKLSVKKQCIRKGHFFLTMSRNICADSIICENTRPLEEDLLNLYMPPTFKNSDVTVYQWSKRPQKYLFFSFRCSVSKIQPLSLFIYSIIIIFLSILGNMLWELIKLMIF